MNIVKIEKTDPLISKSLIGMKDNLFMSDKRKKHFYVYINIWKITHKNSLIYLCIPDNEDIEDYSKVLPLICNRIDFMRNIANNNKYLEIWLYPSNYKKKIPSTNIITPDDINSGLSHIIEDNNGIIYIWRKEELLKVLLHEIIHSFRMDRYKNINVEAYTELFALICNIHLELIERNLPLSLFDKLYESEKEFGIEQCRKISKCINQNTNINFYINEKTRLLHNIDKKEWDNFIEKAPLKKRFVSPSSLRFTITGILLKNYPKKII